MMRIVENGQGGKVLGVPKQWDKNGTENSVTRNFVNTKRLGYPSPYPHSNHANARGALGLI